jgi:hypothetical protein
VEGGDSRRDAHAHALKAFVIRRVEKMHHVCHGIAVRSRDLRADADDVCVDLPDLGHDCIITGCVCRAIVGFYAVLVLV